MTMHFIIQTLDGVDGVQFDSVSELFSDEFREELADFVNRIGKRKFNLFEYYFGTTDRNFFYPTVESNIDPIMKIYLMIMEEIHNGKYSDYEERIEEFEELQKDVFGMILH